MPSPSGPTSALDAVNRLQLPDPPLLKQVEEETGPCDLERRERLQDLRFRAEAEGQCYAEVEVPPGLPEFPRSASTSIVASRANACPSFTGRLST
jgi:hypothetical protein